MKKINYKTEWITWLVIVLPVIYAILIWNSLPAEIPVHFNLQGQADSYGSKFFAVILLPALNAAVYFFLLMAPDIDPYAKNYEQFARSYHIIRLSVAALLSLAVLFTIETSLKHFFGDVRYLLAVIFLFFIVFGNFLKTVKPNFFIGLRTPWTLMNAESWRKTHFMLGKSWFYGGIAGFIISFFAPVEITGYFLFGFAIITTLLSILISFIYFRKETQTNEQ